MGSAQSDLTHRTLKAAPPWGEGEGQGFAIPVTLCGLCHHNWPSYITRGLWGLPKARPAGRRGGGGSLCPSECGLPWTPRCRAFPPLIPTRTAPLGLKVTPITSVPAATTAGAAAKQATRAPVPAPALARRRSTPKHPCTLVTHLQDPATAAAAPRTGRPWKGK